MIIHRTCLLCRCIAETWHVCSTQVRCCCCTLGRKLGREQRKTRTLLGRLEDVLILGNRAVFCSVWRRGESGDSHAANRGPGRWNTASCHAANWCAVVDARWAAEIGGMARQSSGNTPKALRGPSCGAGSMRGGVWRGESPLVAQTTSFVCRSCPLKSLRVVSHLRRSPVLFDTHTHKRCAAFSSTRWRATPALAGWNSTSQASAKWKRASPPMMRIPSPSPWLSSTDYWRGWNKKAPGGAGAVGWENWECSGWWASLKFQVLRGLRWMWQILFLKELSLSARRVPGINETGNYMPNGQPLSVWTRGNDIMMWLVAYFGPWRTHQAVNFSALSAGVRHLAAKSMLQQVDWTNWFA